MKIICTDKCVECKYCNQLNKSKILCVNKNKQYYYGQYVNCDEFEKTNLKNSLKRKK